MKRHLFLFVCALFAGGAAASELPDLGDASRAAISEAQEAQVGHQIMREIRLDADFLDDPVINDYLNALGERLVAASPAPYRQIDFFAVKDTSINAFTLPGGHIGVNTGLIATTRNESELAGVMSHEIGHVVQNHIARSVLGQKSGMMASLAGLAVAILAAHSDNPQIAEAALTTGQAYAAQKQLSETQSYEKEADRVGLRTLSHAGYNPNGMADFFKNLMNQERLYDSNVPGFLRDHPMSYQRMADLQNRAAELKYKPRPDNPEYALIRARVEAEAGDAQDAYKRFSAQAESRDDPATLYGLTLAALRAGEKDRADQAFARLAKSDQSAVVESLGGELLLGTDRVAQAVKALQHAVARYPNYKPLAYAYGRALLRNGKPGQAKSFVLDRQRIWPDDATLYQLLAESDQALGLNAESHLAQAEAYYRQDQTDRAIEQLQLARQSGDGDFYTQSVIDARLHDLRDLQSREKAAERPE